MDRVSTTKEVLLFFSFTGIAQFFCGFFRESYVSESAGCLVCDERGADAYGSLQLLDLSKWLLISHRPSGQTLPKPLPLCVED